MCYAISQLAAGFKDDESSPLSPYFKDIIQALLETVGARTANVPIEAHLCHVHWAACRVPHCRNRWERCLTSRIRHSASCSHRGPGQPLLP